MPYGLKEHIIKEIQNIFTKYSQVEEVILYGSRAKGNYKNGSDIDITLLGEDIKLKLVHKIEDELDDLLLPYTLIFQFLKTSKIKIY